MTLVRGVILPFAFKFPSTLCAFPISSCFIYIYIYTHIYTYIYIYISGLGSSVSIATDYGLDGSGSNPSEDEIFRPSRPALGPTQPTVQWVPVLSRG